jgi:antitoxin (DNA-binding transcriptional repressor) of toxin-antitoxin stability system
MLYNYVHMIQINISQARQNFSELAQKAYFGEEVVVYRNQIPFIKFIKADQEKPVKKIKFDKKALGLFKHLKGTNIEIADWLRETAWKGNYGD